jgi:aspartate/glutamate racemase
MKSIAIIHTVQSVAATFGDTLRNALDEEVKIHTIWDDFLASNPNEIGEFTIENRNRLFYDVKAAELTGADVIVTTCSTLTPVINMIRPFIKPPLIAIDDAMGRKAVTYGPNILVLATADSTTAPTRNKLMQEAEKLGVEVTLSHMVCASAYCALKAMQMDKHDELLLEQVKEVSGYDCIVLAQASMAHLESAISERCGCPVLSSPQLCINEVKEVLKSIK